MSSSSEPKFAQLILSSNLNSTVLFGYFMGMYSMTFFGCIYIYKFKKSNPSPVVVTVLFVLYAVGTAQLGIKWFIANNTFIANGDSWYQAAYAPTGNVLVLLNLSLSTVGYILDNILLIWRCYQVVGKSPKSMIVLFLFLFCQTVLATCNLAYMCTPPFMSSMATIRQFQIAFSINAAFITVTVITSLSTTYITYRRISLSTNNQTKRHYCYRRILTIIIESSAIYILASVFNAVIQIMCGIVVVGRIALSLGILETYSTIASNFTTGFVPTLMVAQLGITATSSDTEKSSEALSTLQFQQPPVHSGQDRQSSQINSSMSRRVLSTPYDIEQGREEIV